MEDTNSPSTANSKRIQGVNFSYGGCEDHSKCSLQLIDWKTEITSGVNGDHWTRKVRSGARPAWQSITPAVRLVIGLTVSGVIGTVSEVDLDASNLVLILCSIKSSPGGHWLTTERHLPTTIDSEPVTGDVEIPRHPSGCLVSVGDRCFQLGCSLSVESRSSCVKKGLVGQQSQHQVNYKLSQMTKSMSNTELSNYAASLVSSQLLMTSLAPVGSVSRDWQPPSRAHIDLLYASFRRATNASQNVKLFRDFVAKSRHVAFSISDRELMKTVNAGKVTEADGEIGLTDHVIEVLTDLIRNTVDPLEHVLLWLELLSDFAGLPVPVVSQSFVRHRTTAVVLGCMTAHARNSNVQQQACHFLSRLVTNWPSDCSPKHQGVKENAIELITDVMKRYLDDIETVRAAITAIAVVTSYMSRYAGNAITLCGEHLDGAKQEEVMRALSILDNIQSVAYQTVTHVNTTHGGNDLQIREQAQLITSLLSTRSSASSQMLTSTSFHLESLRSSSVLSPARHGHYRLMTSSADVGVLDAQFPVSKSEDVPDRRPQEDEDELEQSERIDELIGNHRGRHALIRRVQSHGCRLDNSEGSSPVGKRCTRNHADVTISQLLSKQSIDADDEALAEVPVDRRMALLSSSAGAVVGSPMSSSPLDDRRWLSMHGARTPDTGPRTRRQDSFKAAVRSLLPSTASGPKIVRQNSEMGYRSNCRLDDGPLSTPKKLSAVGARALVLPVGFRRSMSVQSFAVHGSNTGAHGAPSTDDVAKDLKETTLMRPSNRNPDVTDLHATRAVSFVDAERQSDCMAPDLIQRQRRKIFAENRAKTIDQDDDEGSPKLVGESGIGTMRRIVSFSSLPFRPKKDKPFN